jgi:hypothetical protein
LAGWLELLTRLDPRSLEEFIVQGEELMRSRYTSTHRLATALVATLVIGLGGLSAAFTQDPVDKAENWRDQIGPNDKQVTGIVGLVHQDTFELQSHGTMYFFEKPSEAEQQAHLRTGTEVQVFFDPSGYQRDGNSYYRTSVVALNGDPATAPQSRTSTQADQAPVSTRAPVSTDAQSTVVTDDSQQDSTQLVQNEKQDRTAESATRVQGEQDESSDFDGGLDDEQTLPQTAGALPLVGLMGLLGLLGAVALRVLRS